MRRLVWLGGAVLVCGGALAYWLLSKEPTSAEASPLASHFVVKRGQLDITLTENGTLVAKDSRKVVPQFRSEGKILFLLEEGKTVQEGDVICRIDSMQMQTQLEQTELELVQSEAALVSAKTEHEIAIAENAAALEKAKLAIDRARQELDKYRDGDAPQERRNLEIAIKDTDTEHHRAGKRYEDSKKLVEQNFIKRSELEQHAIDFEKAVVKKEGAERALQLFEKFTLPMTTLQKETAVKDAERELETAEKRAKSRINQRQTDVLQAEKRIKRLKTVIDERKKDIDNMTIKAPCPGILIYGDPREPWYREQVKVGGTIYGGNTLMTIPDLRVMQVKIEIHEADINKVKLGLPATVTMDTYPGLVLYGEVARVASIAAAGNPWESSRSEVKKFDVEIVLKDTSKLTLKPGVSAKAEVHIDTRKDVLFVPLQTVFREQGANWCLVAAANREPERREVAVGLNNDTHVEVVSGLEPEDKVLLYDPALGKTRSREPRDGAVKRKGADSRPTSSAAAESSRAESRATASMATDSRRAESKPASRQDGNVARSNQAVEASADTAGGTK